MATSVAAPAISDALTSSATRIAMPSRSGGRAWATAGSDDRSIAPSMRSIGGPLSRIPHRLFGTAGITGRASAIHMPEHTVAETHDA